MNETSSTPTPSSTHTPGGRNTPLIILVAALAVLVIAEAAVLVWMFQKNRSAQTTNEANSTAQNIVAQNTVSTTTNSAVTNTQTNTATTTPTPNASGPKFVSGTPAINQQVTGTLTTVSVTFDAPVHTSSTLVVTRKSLDVTAGATTFSADKKTMLVAVTATGSDTYEVHYTACKEASTSCTLGAYEFVLKSSNENTRAPAESTLPVANTQ